MGFQMAYDWSTGTLVTKAALYIAVLVLTYRIGNHHDTGGDEITYTIKTPINQSASFEGLSYDYDIKKSMTLYPYNSQTESDGERLDEQFKEWPLVMMVTGLVFVAVACGLGIYVMHTGDADRKSNLVIAWQAASVAATAIAWISATLTLYLAISTSARPVSAELNTVESVCGHGSAVDNLYTTLPLLTGNDRSMIGLQATLSNVNPGGFWPHRVIMQQFIDEISAVDPPTNLPAINTCLGESVIRDTGSGIIGNVYRSVEDREKTLIPALVSVLKQVSADNATALSDSMTYRFGSNFITVQPSQIAETFVDFSGATMNWIGVLLLVITLICTHELIIVVKEDGEAYRSKTQDKRIPGNYAAWTKFALVLIYHTGFFIGAAVLSTEFESDENSIVPSFQGLRTEITTMIYASGAGTLVLMLSAGAYVFYHRSDSSKHTNSLKMVFYMGYAGNLIITISFGFILFFVMLYTTDHTNDTSITPSMRSTMAIMQLWIMIPASVMYTVHELQSQHTAFTNTITG